LLHGENGRRPLGMRRFLNMEICIPLSRPKSNHPRRKGAEKVRKASARSASELRFQ
jgi:hypothetical protein